MSNDLPQWISAAVQNMLEGVSRKDLSVRAQAISDSYRGGGTSIGIDVELDALAYALARMPATYAAVRAALSYTGELIEDFAPASLLDVGAGAGAATWASLDAWPSISSATLLDRNAALVDVARKLTGAEGASETSFAFQLAPFESGLNKAQPADLVIASYALTELSLPAARVAVSELWRLSNELLIIVEPGTPDGFKRMLAYRETLIEAGGHIIAPCTHEAACPLVGAQRWCHFSQRLSRSRDHLALKAASLAYEDEKYTYLAMAKSLTRPASVQRILATPNVNKARVSLTLCAPGEVEEKLIERRSGEAYKAAKRADWGDVF
jgi:ribosomal protein RSM22 (predicted rRNA methylase)